MKKLFTILLSIALLFNLAGCSRKEIKLEFKDKETAENYIYDCVTKNKFAELEKVVETLIEADNREYLLYFHDTLASIFDYSLMTGKYDSESIYQCLTVVKDYLKIEDTTGKIDEETAIKFLNLVKANMEYIESAYKDDIDIIEKIHNMTIQQIMDGEFSNNFDIYYSVKEQAIYFAID